MVAATLAGIPAGVSASREGARVPVVTQHDVQLSRLLSACRLSAVAVAANVDPTAWASTTSPRVVLGDRGGYVQGLHRGRLPMVELVEAPQAWDRQTVNGGTIASAWDLRVHVNGPSWERAESLARGILQVCLASLRADPYLYEGEEAFEAVAASPLGFVLVCHMTMAHTYDRDTYETDAVITPAPPIPGVVPPTDVEYPALVNISGGRVITYEGGGWVLADSTNPAHAGVALAVAVGAIIAGDDGAGRLYGVMDDPAWTWPAPCPLYLGAAGVLTPTPVLGGFLREVARALTPTRIMVEPEPAVVLL
jgi:hypothetical protein